MEKKYNKAPLSRKIRVFNVTSINEDKKLCSLELYCSLSKSDRFIAREEQWNIFEQLFILLHFPNVSLCCGLSWCICRGAVSDEALLWAETV